jgi:3-phenylpropionate/trans-cinnamate dioxygenase ferredoxin reductase subunit
MASGREGTGVARTAVIVGGGLAGGSAASTLRQEGFDGRIVLVGAEDYPPYERPPLSKEFLRGEQTLEKGFLRPADWYAEHEVELRTGTTATSIDPAGRTVGLDDGERLAYDMALLATGSRNRRFPIPGLDLEGVLDLRTAADSERIKAAAAAGGRAVVVGMGFIGAEVAASLRSLGVDVAAVEPFETPLFRIVGPEVGRVVESFHRDHGVEMHFGETVDRFEGASRVEAVVTKSGLRLECDFAVVGVGVQPNVEFAEGSGLEVDNGIAVDATLAASAPGVWAAGDVARHDHPVFGPIRVEHFDNALKMGPAAARNMLGAGVPFDDPHWFWSDQYDMNLQMAGFALTWDQLVFRGSVEDRSFTAFYLHEGVLRSVLSVNRARDVRRAMPLIKAAARPDPAQLRNDDVDLRTLAPPPAS